MSNFLESKKTRIILWIIGSVVLLLVVFGAGMAVGYQRGIFASRFGENYYANFHGSSGPTGGTMMLGGPSPMNQHGAAGTVVDVNASSSSITATDPNGNEESVTVDANTIIRMMDRTIPLDQIQPGDRIVVIGEPSSSGQIQARFIRIFSGSSSIPLPPPFGQ